MKLMLLVVCSMIAMSLASPYSDKEAKLEAALNDIEVVLQDLQADGDEPHPEGDFQKLGELQEVLDEAIVEGDLSFLKQVSQESPAMEEMLLHTKNIDEAVAEVEAAGGRVSMQLGHNLLIAQVPTHVAKQNSFTRSSAHISSSASQATLNHVNAYYMGREDRLKPQPEVLKWTEKTAPMAFSRKDSDNIFGADSPYRQTMTGKISVGIVIASGPGSLAISATEQQTIISEVQTGLKFWTDQAQLKGVSLQFVLYSGKATITASSPSSCSSYAACHNVFADPSLQYFGQPTGQTGRDQLAKSIKDAAGADGAFLGFFSKYRQSHFAYAYSGGGPLYMQYSNDGWGSNQIDRVFAHETGHVFNAPDEYTNCQCSVQYGRGSCTDTNDNCNNNNGPDCTYSQASCIMDSNDLSSLCEHSKKHVGWC